MSINRETFYIEAKGLSKIYTEKKGLFSKRVISKQVLNNINITVKVKQNIGIVGESGAGKTTLIETLIGLRKPTAGQISWEGRNINALKNKEVLEFRKKFQIVFQDVDGSLYARKRVYDLVVEGLNIHFSLSKNQLFEKIEKVIDQLMLSSNILRAFPTELSGGEKKRICLARSLVLNPKLLIMDEPTSGLDALLQANLIYLLKGLCENYNLTLIIVSHDLRTVYFLVDYILVMYSGNIVEEGEKENIFRYPRHPYTKNLLKHSPGINIYEDSEISLLAGYSAVLEPSIRGCPYHPFCNHRIEVCKSQKPCLKFNGSHGIACFNP